MDWINRFQSVRNSVDFALRNRFCWQIGKYAEPHDNQHNTWPCPESFETAVNALIQRGYNIQGLHNRLPQHRYQEVMAYLQWLDYATLQAPDWFRLTRKPDDVFHWVDVGAKNWAYVDAFPVFLQRWILPDTPGFLYQITGIEVDAHRRYSTLKSRKQAAEYFIRDIPQAQYVTDNFLNWHSPVDLITHFLPFVFEDPLLAWGLPLRLFTPLTLLAHGLDQLKPGGLMLIVNQGEEEFTQQGDLLNIVQKNRRIAIKPLGQLPLDCIAYQHPRYGWLIQQNI